jgi:hypothetical protein
LRRIIVIHPEFRFGAFLPERSGSADFAKIANAIKKYFRRGFNKKLIMESAFKKNVYLDIFLYDLLSFSSAGFVRS